MELTLIKKIDQYGRLVMFSHSIFSLSFALVSMAMASKLNIDFKTLVYAILALMFARTGANAINRLIDAYYDERNPRTSTRHIPQGTVSKKETLVLSIVNFVFFVVFANLLNPLCAILSPVALFFLVTYSYTKRYTFLCHLYLGFTCAIATMGGYLAITGAFLNLWPFTMFISNMFWVAGFDIIYGSQDYDFDKSIGLHSMATQFGVKGALNIAILLHFVSIVFLFLTGFLYGNFNDFYYIIIGIIAILLSYEHIIVAKTKFKHIKIASYGINQIVAIIFMLSILTISR